MLRGSSDVNRQREAVENAMVTLSTPGPEYSVLTGHNTARRKRRLRPEELSRYVYTPETARLSLSTMITTMMVVLLLLTPSDSSRSSSSSSSD